MDESTARSRHPDSMRKAFLWALLPSLVLFLITPPTVSLAQLVTNITPTQTAPLDLGTEVNTVGTTTQITGGNRPGSGTNLFHSFDAFTLGTGDIAHFMNDMQRPTTNIVGRVIGGEISEIDGTLRTNNPLDAADPMNFGAASLWLVNPSGLLLGPNARIEVGGSVSMSTANYLGFDGTSTLFDMLSSPASLDPLSVAPVMAFGFLGPQPAPITVQGSILQVPEGQSLSLVGGDITVQAETFEDGTIQAASLSAPGGQLNLVSVASPGEVLVPGFQAGSFSTMGTVMLKEGAGLDVSGQFDEFGTPISKGNSGTVFVRGGQLVMDGSTILANTVGSVDGASRAVDIQVSQDAALTNGSGIFTRTRGPGRGGDVQLTTATMTMDGSLISTNTNGGDGDGGHVVLNVEKLSLMGGSLIRSQSTSVTPGLGQGGDVTIQGLPGAEFGAAETVTLSGGSKLFNESFGSGHGGRVTIISKSLTMDDFATVDAIAHNVSIAGDIVVDVQQARLSGGATIATHTSGESNLMAGGRVTVQGLGEPKADSVVLSGGSGIVSETTGEAPSGDIALLAKRVSLTDGAVIQTGIPESIGPAGNVTIDADSVDISGGSQILSQSAAGEAGQVAIKANTLTLDNVSIETNTSSGGRGGDVVLNVGTVSLSNGSTINSSTFEAGRAGDITMNVGSLTLGGHAEITSSSQGTVVDAGDAGIITIESGSTLVMNDSSITTESIQASGGQITITAPDMVRLTNSRISTSVEGNATDSNGGNIAIDPQFVILQNSQIIAQANAGTGGTINIVAGVFVADPASIVDASAKSGNSGTVSIQSPVQNLGEQLTPMPQQFSSAAALLAQRCAARVADGKFSTFVVAGREGLPVELGGFLASPSWTAELLGASLSGLYPHIQFPAVTGSFLEYDARPIQLAKLGDACH